MRFTTRVATIAAVTMAVALLLAGCGGDDGKSAASDADRTIDVTMTDNAYEPAALEVASGETVTLRFHNTGKTTHEAVIGDEIGQMKHHFEMTASTASMADGAMEADEMDGHDTPESGSAEVTVEPGMSGDITHTFTEAGTILIGCHEPGHWESGMKATIAIS